jgi:phage shock protein E
MLRRFGAVLFGKARNALTMEQALREKDLLVVDVRTVPEIISTGKIGSAVNIPVDSLPTNSQALGNDKTRPILFYCAKGIRSAQAAMFARQLGYLNAFSTTDSRSAQNLIDSVRDESS